MPTSIDRDAVQEMVSEGAQLVEVLPDVAGKLDWLATGLPLV